VPKAYPGLLFAAALTAFARAAGDVPLRPTGPAVCFAPGTALGYRERIETASARWTTKAYTSNRWFTTATDGVGLVQGDPTTLTWAVVPDGTTVPAGLGTSGKPSDLRAFLNGIYGDESKWLPLFEKTFARWSELTGVRYVHETADDGVPLSAASGRLGVRADIRIGGKALDGDFGVLAYNSYPDDGDMVIDTSDAWFRNTGLDSRRLRNVVSHEHGHGLGMDHSCPVNATKLMEPNVALGFAGPQHDDVLGGQRLYGDPMERNDTTTNATDLGEPENETELTVEDVGIDDAADTDLYAFTVSEGTNADVRLSPFGKVYDNAPETVGGCTTPTQVDTRARANLRLALLNPDGTLIASTDAAPAGFDEALLDVPLPRGAGRYFVRVRNGGEQLNQMYSLELTVGRRGETPAAVADASTTWEALPVATPVLANDSGVADAPLKLRVVTPPASGKAIVDGDRIVYVPARGFTGEARYVYEVKDVHTQTSTAEVVVTVLASARAGNARIDTDADGYPDEFETARGTAPDDPDDFPGDDVSAGATPLDATSLALSLRTDRPASDSVVLTGRLAVAEGFDPTGASVVASVAGVVREFVLDATGRSFDGINRAPTFRLRLKKKRGVVLAAFAKFELRLSHGDFAASWTDEGLTTERKAKKEPRAATAIVQFGGVTRVATLPMAYTAKKGVSGAAKSVK
jgi:hypothetical protein